jgi:hypothetical protein
VILLLGIDDTDDDSSRGTGYQARRLGNAIQENGLGELRAVTRHQLLVDSRIDYTSRNSSACLVLQTTEDQVPSLIDLARSELVAHCAPGSKVGICLSEPSAVDDAIREFGRAAKDEVLFADAALSLGKKREIHIECIKGSGEGVIGALAAIGLHASGDDGRFVWLPKLRDLDRSYTVAELGKLLNVQVETISGDALPPLAEIKAEEWMRPILRQGRAILLAEKENVDGEIGWRFADKPTVKALSN